MSSAPAARDLANAIRALSMDAVQKAKSGHPGAPMGMADIAEVLWRGFLKHNPANPHWVDRDRFVLSNGHGSMLLYSLLHLTGYGVSLDDLKNFRQLGSPTAGHPEFGDAPGIVVTGASGRMGRMLIRLLLDSDQARLVGALERPGHDWIGRDIGEAMGGQPAGVMVSDDVVTVIARAQAVIDFTAPSATLGFAELAAQARAVHVIGTTGLEETDLAQIAAAARHAPIIRAGTTHRWEGSARPSWARSCRRGGTRERRRLLGRSCRRRCRRHRSGVLGGAAGQDR